MAPVRDKYNQITSSVGAQQCFTLRLEGCAPACPGTSRWARTCSGRFPKRAPLVFVIKFEEPIC
jgi:hypothetical protein